MKMFKTNALTNELDRTFWRVCAEEFTIESYIDCELEGSEKYAGIFDLKMVYYANGQLIFNSKVRRKLLSYIGKGINELSSIAENTTLEFVRNDVNAQIPELERLFDAIYQCNEMYI